MDQAYIYMKISEYPPWYCILICWGVLALTLLSCVLVLSAQSLCKQVGPRSGRAESGSNLLDTQVVIQKDFFSKKLILKENQQTTKKLEFPRGGKELKCTNKTSLKNIVCCHPTD